MATLTPLRTEWLSKSMSIDGLVQDCGISSGDTTVLHQATDIYLHLNWYEMIEIHL